MPQVKQIDIKAIFEKNAGHAIEPQKKTIIHIDGKPQILVGDFRPKKTESL